MGVICLTITIQILLTQVVAKSYQNFSKTKINQSSHVGGKDLLSQSFGKEIW